MEERRMELKIGSPVVAKDGHCGHIQQLILDPYQAKVIGLAVKPGLLSRYLITVPIEQIMDATESEVRLKLDCQQVSSLPKCVPSSNNPGTSESQIHKEIQLPVAISIQAGQHVFCQDGYIGRVQLLLLNPSGKINSFVLRTWGQDHHDFIVPVDWVQEVDLKYVHLSVKKQAMKQLDEYVTDAELADKISHAIRENNALWMTRFSDIGTTVQDGIVTLRGHVPTSMDKLLVENVVKSVAAVLGVENRLMVDYDLTIEVAQALGRNECTRQAMISVNTRNGVVSLSGHVEKASVYYMAEEIAGSVPFVRGVINYIQAPGVVKDPVEERFLQPLIGEEVHVTDMCIGTVDKVIINPHNRRVIAFVVHAFFPDPRIVDLSQLPDDDSYQSILKDCVKERRVVFPTRLINHETDSVVSLDINGIEAANYHDYDSTQYSSPPDEWQPPYPYCIQDILFEGLKKRLFEDLHQLADRAVKIEQNVSAAVQEPNEMIDVSIHDAIAEASARQELYKAMSMHRRAAPDQWDEIQENFLQRVQGHKKEIETEKEVREVKSAKERADAAEIYAEAVIGFAIQAIDQVEIAMLEAIETVKSEKSVTRPELAQF